MGVTVYMKSDFILEIRAFDGAIHMNTVKVFMKVDLFSMEGNGPESKSKSCSVAHKLQEFKTLAY